MKIFRATVLGYCMGVRRAMEAAEEALEKYIDKKIFTFGPLIHNKQALLPLEEKGLGILEEDDIENLDEKNPPVVIIRAHGISPFTLEKLKSKNCMIVDATCPLVLANQKKAASYAKDGFQVILAGDKNHGEVVGIAGFAEYEKSGSCNLLETEEDAIRLVANLSENQRNGKWVLLCQTTFSSAVFDKIAKVLTEANLDCVILKTICNATNERQKSLLDLCKTVDGVIVVGGKNSANTQRLYLSAKANCKMACHIEKASEIPDSFCNLEKVGITAGASTPDNVIEEVEKRLKKEGHSDPLSDAITQSIKNGILSEYLERKSKEVRNMLLAEYDYDTDIAVQRKEAYDDGLETGRKQGIEQEKINTAKKLLSMGLSIEQISEGTGLSLEQVKKLQE